MRKFAAALAVVMSASLAMVTLAPSTFASKPVADGVSVAKAIVSKYSANPTGLGDIPVIGKPIPKGKYIIAIAADNDSGARLNNYTAKAGEILGWKVHQVSSPPSQEALRQALQSAISKNPDGIAVAGLETAVYGDLYEQAQSKGIAVVCSACMSRPGNGLVDSHIAGPKMLDLWGKMMAAFTVANVKGTPNVQMFGLPVYPILLRYDKAYQKHLKRFSPSATFTFNEFDLGTGVPKQVADVYKANPGTNFISSDLGDYFIGVPEALFTVGAVPGQRPLIGGLTAGKTAIQALKDKTENAWTGYSHPIVGFSVIDSFARYFTKVPFATADLPTQILTQKNIASAVLTPQGDYLGVKDYVSQFKEIWGVE